MLSPWVPRLGAACEDETNDRVSYYYTVCYDTQDSCALATRGTRWAHSHNNQAMFVDHTRQQRPWRHVA
jgi:hypothetical protein